MISKLFAALISITFTVLGAATGAAASTAPCADGESLWRFTYSDPASPSFNETFCATRSEDHNVIVNSFESATNYNWNGDIYFMERDSYAFWGTISESLLDIQVVKEDTSCYSTNDVVISLWWNVCATATTSIIALNGSGTLEYRWEADANGGAMVYEFDRSFATLETLDSLSTVPVPPALHLSVLAFGALTAFARWRVSP